MLDVAISTATTTALDPQIANTISELMGLGLQAALLTLTTAMAWGVRIGLASMKSEWKRTLAARLVRFAEQRIEPTDERREYVAEKLHKQFPKISKEEIEHLLEEAVVNLKAGLKTV